MPTSRQRKKKAVAQPQRKSVAQLIEARRTVMLNAYGKHMVELKRRMKAIHGILTRSKTTGYLATDYESMALNFRKIAELIVFASLVGHEREYAALYPKYQKEWRIKDIMQKLKAINPRYYLHPTIKLPGQDIYGAYTWEDVPQDQWLSEDELVAMYDACSSLIHAQQASAPDRDLSEYAEKFRNWYSKIVILTRHHSVFNDNLKGNITCVMNGFDKPPQIVFFGDVTQKYAGRYDAEGNAVPPTNPEE